jgi:hypothetical protein
MAVLVMSGVSLGVNTHIGFNIAEDGTNYATGNINPKS